MARPPRIQFPGALYHIIVRGNQKQDIFLDEADRMAYLGKLKHYKHRYGFVLYAYALMTNHVHLLIETQITPISKIMQGISFTYTQYFNRRYGKVGHLFQGRYKSFLCDRDAYLLRLVRYIHLNPVRAKIIRKPEAYPWSSHTAYLRRDKNLVDVDRVLPMFSPRVAKSLALYQNFVNAVKANEGETLYNIEQQQILGEEQFVARVERTIQTKTLLLRKPGWNVMVRAIETVTGISEPTLSARTRNPKVILARKVLLRVGREFGYRMVALQPKFKRDLSVLSRWSQPSSSANEEKVYHRVLNWLNAYLHA